MQEYIFENNLKLIYKKSESELSSICISLEAGAGVEKDILGIAHATEHMVFKNTKNRNEAQINKELSSIFGFHNAMTNYPYVIYYGTLLSDELEKGIEIFSDIIINTEFKEDGFKEEMNVIIEELNEWDEEIEQYCEDKLFLNSFQNRRIKYPIIGLEDQLKSIKLEDVKRFYEEYYFPGNTSIAVISSLEFEEAKNLVEKYFGLWEKKIKIIEEVCYENNISDTFLDKRDGVKTCKVQMIFPVHELSRNEISLLRIFDEYFGQGVNSMLFDTLRTKNGLVYDVITNIAHEKYIKFYKITFSTSKENVSKSIELIKECINKLVELKNSIDMEDIKQLVKSYKLKKLFKEEKSIVLAKEISTYDTMFGDYKVYTKENLDNISKEDVFNVGIKTLKNPSIEIIY
ncbi:M16 family metallopeptidase [Clostridium botulinum]|uniref:M16 family metallopeptidase n=1 Tax=Clostridium botulinum TaxID=1491 RepID=UPI000773DE78|nr:pitrilysin family protein [Clostridium botulinum]NFE95885.1 insulinase family protein [Clostridium botulinum]NFG24711.1 insulinase family protein [Clostridium botulinum]NFL39479.1 insulinase family protein [Clostridium botulinum]NFL66064.1 insulinase family protein [Clostridium botulinum]NFN09335.1 insulinase family protein [Clostridium botulinum]